MVLVYLMYPLHMVPELLEVLDVSVADLADHEVALALASAWLTGLHRRAARRALLPGGGGAVPSRQRGDRDAWGTALPASLNTILPLI